MTAATYNRRKAPDNGQLPGFLDVEHQNIQRGILGREGEITLPAEGRTVSDTSTYLQNNAVYNAMDFGALGTGTADDTQALLRTSNAIPVAGGVMDLPKGNYGVSDDIIIRRSNVHLRGAGAGLTTISILSNWTALPVVSSVAAILNLLAFGTVTGNEGLQIKNIEISGIRFLGIRPTADPDTAPKAIGGNYAHNVWVHDCIFEEICREVIWVAGTGIAPSTAWKITHNHFVNCGVLANASDQSCVNLNTDDSVVALNTFRDVGSAVGLYSKNSTCIGNTINGVYQWGIKIGEGASQGWGNVISGNTIDITANATREVRGIQAVGQVGGGARYTTISGNQVKLTSVAGMVQPKAIVMGSATTGASDAIRVTGNVVQLDMANVAVTTYGILSQSDGGKAEIDNNTVKFLNVNDTVFHAGVMAIATNGLTMETQARGNKVFSAGPTFGAAFYLTRSGTGVHKLVAQDNVCDSGYHQYDGTNYTINVNDVPVSFVSRTGVGGVGTISSSETRGVTSVADGGTITHKQGATPTRVSVTGSVASQMVSVTAIGATTFTVAIKKDDGTAGSTQNVYWTTEVIPT